MNPIVLWGTFSQQDPGSRNTMEVGSKGQTPVFVRAQTARPEVEAGTTARSKTVSDSVARSIEQAQAAIDIRSGLAEARRSHAANQVANLKAQADTLRVLSVVAPAAFAEFANGLSKQLSATVSAYADGGDPEAIRQQVRNLSEWIVSIDEREIGGDTAPDAPAAAGQAADAGVPAAEAGETEEGGASWEDLVAEVKGWLAADDARLETARQGWFAAAGSATPDQAQDRQLAAEAREVQQRLDSLVTGALSRIEDGETARSLAARQLRTTGQLDIALTTIEGWGRGTSSRPPAGGVSILA